MGANKLSGIEKAYSLLQKLPRVSLDNLYKLKVPNEKKIRRRSCHHADRPLAYENKGPMKHQRYFPLGWELGRLPQYMKIPSEPYYQGHHVRRQYPPITLKQLQTLIDTGRLNPKKPIDLVALCNTGIFRINPQSREYGFQLTADGMDYFQEQLNIEVQWTTEPVIAAIERSGGVITTAYYDPDSLFAMKDVKHFFSRGIPIPKRKIPPPDAVEYYTDPKFRGYLSDPLKISEERFVLSQKYGYKLPDYSNLPNDHFLKIKKDPRQVFYGLEPGMFVNLTDKILLKPLDPDLQNFYKN